MRGTVTSPVEVTNVSPHGFWLLLKSRELFVPFSDFPWFRNAPIGDVVNVELPSPHHLYWPSLDVDLELDSIEHPERYPLVSRDRPNQRMDLTTASGTPPARLRPRRSSGQTGFTPPGRAGKRRAGPR
jgi:hypothetical protein